MVQFIKQEAEEKANEIAVAAEEARARHSGVRRAFVRSRATLPQTGVQH